MHAMNHAFIASFRLLIQKRYLAVGTTVPLTVLLLAPLLSSPSVAQDKHWDLRPAYSLPRNAETEAGQAKAELSEPLLWSHDPGPTMQLMGQSASEPKRTLAKPNELPKAEFTLQACILDHTNQPVGAAIGVLPHQATPADHWMLTYFNRKAAFVVQTSRKDAPIILEANLPRREKAFLSWFYQITVAVDGEKIRLYVNGELEDTAEVAIDQWKYGNDSLFEVVSYLANEPYMETGNLVCEVTLSDHAWSSEEVKKSFQTWAARTEAGRLYDDRLHFNAGPYLNYGTEDSMSLVWETDRETAGDVYVGETTDLARRIELTKAEKIHKLTIDQLNPGTTYYYRVVARDASGTEIDSGILTFKTAVGEGHPIRFAVIGDTESRPYVNNRISQLVWGERPDFLLNLGDLTDGGMEDEKFQWNEEYFQGMGAISKRIATFAVPGNGEGDLFWYNQYHAFPDPISFYTFKYGDARFFMLDSNRMIDPDSEQYEWLRRELASDSSKWRIVCFHHCAMSSDEDDYGDTWNGEKATFTHKNVASMIPVFEEYDVDLVYFGHVHCYERSWPLRGGKVDRENGVVYIESGGAGGNLEDFAPTATWFSNRIYRGHHYGIVNIEGDLLTYKMVDSEGRLRDLYERRKSSATTNARSN